ncbi:MAG: hypothetical protein RLZZ185_631 [Bacteroidota bacterium]|jgi:hypothetical protein
MILTNLTQSWGLMRIIRLLFGGYALIEAYRGNDALMAVLGFVLVSMAILNAGCGAQGCGVPMNKSTSKETDEVSYEEVHSK